MEVTTFDACFSSSFICLDVTVCSWWLGANMTEQLKQLKLKNISESE